MVIGSRRNAVQVVTTGLALTLALCVPGTAASVDAVATSMAASVATSVASAVWSGPPTCC